ncbi:MAG TPA: EF-hand domain-containing protein [Kofleriaceae bacterium]|nr:EF-hand domain-containing protein [Kofleriaceae bacterium]
MRERAREDAAIETNEQEAEEVPEQPSRTRFVGGAIPPVQVAQEHEDPNVIELKQKVQRLVTSKFGGDYKKAFDHYDGDQDGKMTKDEIKQMLSDAGVGNGLTRGAWADGILKKLDMNHDSGVQWGEFESVFKATA